MKYIVDIDGTICNGVPGNYENAMPLQDRINKINALYDQGHEITYWTARGGISGIDYTELTAKQLRDWGVKHHKLLMKKPVYDLWIDDKAINSEEYFK